MLQLIGLNMSCFDWALSGHTMSTCYFTARIKLNINDTLRQHRIVLNIFVDFSLFPGKIYSSYCVMLVSLWNNNRTFCCLVLYVCIINFCVASMGNRLIKRKKKKFKTYLSCNWLGKPWTSQIKIGNTQEMLFKWLPTTGDILKTMSVNGLRDFVLCGELRVIGRKSWALCERREQFFFLGGGWPVFFGGGWPVFLGPPP